MRAAAASSSAALNRLDRGMVPQQLLPVNLDITIANTERKSSKPYRVACGWLRMQGEPEAVRGTHNDATGSSHAVLQRTSRVRASSIEDIDAAVNVRDTNKAAEYLAYLNPARDNLALPYHLYHFSGNMLPVLTIPQRFSYLHNLDDRQPRRNHRQPGACSIVSWDQLNTQVKGHDAVLAPLILRPT
jgi:hypothetical protein